MQPDILHIHGALLGRLLGRVHHVAELGAQVDDRRTLDALE